MCISYTHHTFVHWSKILSNMMLCRLNWSEYFSEELSTIFKETIWVSLTQNQFRSRFIYQQNPSSNQRGSKRIEATAYRCIAGPRSIFFYYYCSTLAKPPEQKIHLLIADKQNATRMLKGIYIYIYIVCLWTVKLCVFKNNYHETDVLVVSYTSSIVQQYVQLIQ